MCFVEQFDQRKFCKYYLRLYKKLKAQDRERVKRYGPSQMKFSSAFSEFTCLIYANMHEIISGNYLNSKYSSGSAFANYGGTYH